MKLIPQPAIIDWPFNKPLPKPGERINAGDLGTGVVVETEVQSMRSNQPPHVRVAVDLYFPIE